MSYPLEAAGLRGHSSITGDTDVAADPKPAKPYRASQREWADIRHAFGKGSRCRVCGGDWKELHHLVSRGAGRGDDVLVNLIPLCHACHLAVEARKPYARAKIREGLTEGNRWYVTSKFGTEAAGWLDRNYPELAA